MGESTRRPKRRKQSKPDKPYPDFPLFPHASGRWAKKVCQRTHFFGRWGNKRGSEIVPVDDVDASARAAKEEFDRQWPYISTGRTAPPNDTGDGCRLGTLCSAFLNAKLSRIASGELSERSFRDYRAATDQLITTFGKDRRVDDLRPDDFERLRATIAARCGTVRLRNEINHARIVFKFAVDQRLIDRPVNFGQGFDRPSAKALRRVRNQAGPRLFDREELQLILAATAGGTVTVGGKKIEFVADPTLRAMVLLGLNCGFGNTDVARLPQSAVRGAWIDYPRPKTEIPRRVPLWQETQAALRAAIAVRPASASPEDDGLCFLTRFGKPWVRMQAVKSDVADPVARATHVPVDPLSQRFTRLLRSLKLNTRKGRGFYTLRHVFETIGGESRDQVAVNSIMGHVDSSMAAVYREGVSDDRLQVVVNVVRDWLFTDGGAA